MPYDAERHRRRSIRLPSWDYAGQGWYFLTIVAAGRECLFGDIDDGTVILSDAGQIVDEELQRTLQLRPEVTLGAYVVMPNHVHAVVAIAGDGDPLWDDARALRHSLGVRRPLRRSPRSLSTIVGGFKGAATRRVVESWDAPGMAVWQRGFYEHIIRDDRDLERIHDYILANPSRWDEDALHPSKPAFRPPARRSRGA